jgi:tRNA uridine 5-carboxymethylaminomethyl modification enzyme
MFTSRAEFRLHLRIDNADERLTPIARRVGLVSDERWSVYQHKQQLKARISALLEQCRVGREIAPDLPSGERPPLAVWLRRPEASIRTLQPWLERMLGEPVPAAVAATVETEMKYAGYISQQQRQIERLRTSDGRTIPEDFAYSDVPGLSTEVRQKLTRVRPTTLGQAARIPGVTPAAIAVLDVYLSIVR